MSDAGDDKTSAETREVRWRATRRCAGVFRLESDPRAGTARGSSRLRGGAIPRQAGKSSLAGEGLSEARFGGDPAGFDCRGEILIVAVVLFGVRF